MSDFFDKQPEPEIVPEHIDPDKIKIGDDEYTQEELSKLVGLGKLGLEAEEKYSTKIDRIWPEFTRTTQEKKELEQRLQEMQNLKPAAQEDGLTPEQKEIARKQLIELMGGEPMTQKTFNDLYVQRRGAEKLLEDTEAVVSEMREQGNPATNVNDLLLHMEQTGIKNPQKAYKDMFEADLDRIKEQKLRSIKPDGMSVIQGSSAGSKQPSPVKVTKDNISDLLQSTLNRG